MVAHEEMEEVAVIGAGQMGLGVAQVLATTGVRVIIFDVSEDVVDKAIGTIASGLDRLVSRDKMSEDDAAAAKSLIEGVASPDGDYSRLANCGLVIEAVPEVLELKERVLSAIAASARPDAIIASNTSSISMTKLATFVPAERRAAFAGLHFFNPVPVAVGETVILLHPPLPLVGVSIAMERERQQNDSLANG